MTLSGNGRLPAKARAFMRGLVRAIARKGPCGILMLASPASLAWAQGASQSPVRNVGYIFK